ncbi:MAG: general secretion pathway protein GspK, partial [Bdellovibrionales bacterium]|nr:general secretion pathway protein GspK [Bdellovibrionales bacterium]
MPRTSELIRPLPHQTPPRKCDERHRDSAQLPTDERGFALIMTVFVIALATIIVMNFSSEALSYQRATRSYTDRVQADFMLKSSLNLARVLLELPKEEGIREDWLGEPWALIAAAPSLPISGFLGEPRLMIVDESGKINLNAVAGTGGSAGGNPFGGAAPSPTGGPTEVDDYWKNVLRELFLRAGFVRDQYPDEQKRTLGNVALEASDQVAVLHDWIDTDNRSHANAAFPGEGIESSADQTWFYNRPLRTLSEAALVPGMTLERLARIAPYVTASASGGNRININTAPLEVLLALGFPEA